MCHALDSIPPVPPIAGAAITHRRVVLEGADGTRFAAFAALPEGGTARAGIVVLPDVRGLYRFYEELALRFAERGIASVAIDYFGRTAGVAGRDEDFDFMAHVMQTRAETIQHDVAAAVAFLRSDEAGGCQSVFTVGFCFGGRHSWLAAASGHALAGAVGFYGMPGASERFPGPGPIDRAAEMRAPILALMAGADHAITADAVAEFDAALTAAGVEHEIVTYPGAPHSFFDRHESEFQDASDDAWRRVLAFVETHA